MQKLLSIITVTYNAEEYLRECIESVKILKSKYDSMIEYIIIDGKSTDKTTKIIEEYYMSGVVDFYLSESDEGIFDAMNKGINHSTGEYILIVGSDDFLLPQNFEKVIEHLKIEKPDVCYGDAIFISRSDNKIVRLYKSGKYRRWKIELGWHPPHAGTIVKKSLLAMNMFSVKYKIAADIEIHWRTFMNCNSVIYERTYLVACRMGGTSTKSFKYILKANKEVYEIAKSLGYKMPTLAVLTKLVWKSTQVLRAKLANRKKLLSEIEFRKLA